MEEYSHTYDNTLTYFDAIDSCINVDTVCTKDDQHGHVNIVDEADVDIAEP